MVFIKTTTAWLGIVGFAISSLGYLLNARGRNVAIVVGMALLVIGYSLLVAGEAESESPDSDDVDLNDYALTGYFFVFLFFFGIHVFPRLTVNVRYYDKFAAVGAFLRFVPTTVTSTAGATFLAVYYVLGSIPKFFFKKDGIVDYSQMISRPMLAVYYVLTVYIIVVTAIEKPQLGRSFIIYEDASKVGNCDDIVDAMVELRTALPSVIPKDPPSIDRSHPRSTQAGPPAASDTSRGGCSNAD